MRTTTHATGAIALAAAFAIAASAPAVAGQPAEWIKQFGASLQTAFAVATSPDQRIHIVGQTSGDFAGAKGDTDAFVYTLDAAGNELWRRQPGTTEADHASDVATDGLGNVYVAGYTRGGSLGGPFRGGVADTFLLKLDAGGRSVWKRQPGTSEADFGAGVATDPGGNVYVVGGTEGSLGGANRGSGDAFVIKFDPAGHTVWKRQPGTTAFDQANAVTTDADGNVYVAGGTGGALAGHAKGDLDAFVIKFDPDGRMLWKGQFGSNAEDRATAVAVDADGSAYVVGVTAGSLAAPFLGGTYDAFIVKLDRNGRLLWQRQPATRKVDQATGVAIDSNQTIYVVGLTEGTLGGPNLGSTDFFIIAFDATGRRLWVHQSERPFSDEAFAVAIDASDHLYLLGSAGASLVGPPAPADPAFVIKYPPGGPR